MMMVTFLLVWAGVVIRGSEVVFCDPGGVVGKNEVDPKEVVVVDGVGEDAVTRRRLGVVF